MSKLWTPDNAGKIIPVVRVRPLEPPPPTIGARLQAQHLHWQLGRYVEDLSFGPGGRGRRRRWVVDQEAEQHNLVLNQTYDTLIAQFGFRDLNDYAVVGTGTTPPAASQIGLANEVARTRRDQNASTSGTYSLSTVQDGVYEITRIREFSEAEVGNRNLTEWGFSPSGTAGNNLMSRELFRDGNGNPIVITPASDQRLRLIYKIRISTGPTTPQTVSIDIAGIGVRTGLFVINRSTDPNYGYQMWYDTRADLGLIHHFARADTGLSVYNRPMRVRVTPSYTGFFFLGSQGWGSLSQWYYCQFQAYTAGSRLRRTQSVTYAPGDFNDTLVGFALWLPAGGGGYLANALMVLNTEQEFTKTNLYRLTIGEWTLTWGP
ncbi:hypothetical protein KZX47_11840 [Thermus sp. SYSU G05001]|uniref:Uncharacterized protein n=1 Tax=Thermus brevis TaxID=2862456 RepID=A0ABS7A169_9DEIN|nr:hypothetical protein [Thermus brevis]MBW6395835.1 hypothetical protein [Thermus brevis]